MILETAAIVNGQCSIQIGRELLSSTKLVDAQAAWPSWSPAGDVIAHTDLGTNLMVTPITGGTSTIIYTPSGDNRVFGSTWAPDGSKIAFVEREGAGGQGSVGRGLNVLTFDPYTVDILVHPTAFQSIRFPDWSRGGGHIAFSGVVTGSNTEATYVVDVTTGTISLLANIGGSPPSPSWSPDDSQIVIVNRGIEIIDAATGQTIASLARKGDKPDWRRF